MLDSPPPAPDKSPAPPSSRFAAANAERDVIRRLRKECHILSSILRTLPRSSNKWTVINSELEISREELACMLEDRRLLRSFAGGNGDAAESDAERSPPLIPTPPLGRKDGLDTDNSIGAISEPPLTVVEGNPNSSHESQISQRQALDSVPKYSLEWFQIKREIGAVSKQGKNRTTIPNSPSSSGTTPLVSSSTERPKMVSPPGAYSQTSTYRRGRSDGARLWNPDDQRKTILPPGASSRTGTYRRGKSDGARSRNPPGRRKTEDLKLELKELLGELRTVPRHSLEWFAIRKAFVAAAKIASAEGNEKLQNIGQPSKLEEAMV